ncbi:hypothetical protein ACXAUS_002657 [Clostridium sporogenes]|uniref:hypothetical protein n=1 Tax=Clostridium sporogenes TaxID=1509 RepID=UPI000696A5E9|nr:hypothetical protein [Clostridium sporogenes]MDU5011800.1 hypothetical protein [Clostridium botulinum]
MIEKTKGFYQLNNEVLKFDVNKEINKIRFNQYICQKENLQRISRELPKGQFYMTINSVRNDLNITFAESRGLIKKFIELGIISNAYTPPKGSKKPSIWQYNSVVFTNNDDNNDDNNDINNEEVSNINVLDGVVNNDSNNEENNDINNSKKEYIKRKYKKNIYYIDLKFIDDVVDRVKITQEQYDKLVKKFNEDTVHKNIISLDNYIANGKGKKYKEHYRVLNTWCNKSKPKDKQNKCNDWLKE